MKKDDIFPVDENDEDVMVTLSLDDGTEVSCEILTIFTAGARDYIVLLPLDQAGNPPEDGTVYIYRYEEDETGAPSQTLPETCRSRWSDGYNGGRKIRA